MKVANVIIAHKNPDQLLRLINQFDGSQFHHFVHIDKRCKMREFSAVGAHPDVTLLPVRRKMVYAGYGFVRATLDALNLIKRNEEKFFYVNVMSGMDFPSRPTGAFYEFLKMSYLSGPKEFFEILDISVWPGAHRFERFHLTDWTIKGRYFLERMINRFIPKRQFYNGKFVPYGRAAWFTASDYFIDYALKYFKQNPGYIQFLKTTWSPDEFIFNTLIMNSPFKDKVFHYLRYIDWSEGRVTPKVFRSSDIDDLLKSGCFLARKFDETADKAILDELEKAISKPMMESPNE